MPSTKLLQLGIKLAQKMDQQKKQNLAEKRKLLKRAKALAKQIEEKRAALG